MKYKESKKKKRKIDKGTRWLNDWYKFEKKAERNPAL